VDFAVWGKFPFFYSFTDTPYTIKEQSIISWCSSSVKAAASCSELTFRLGQGPRAKERKCGKGSALGTSTVSHRAGRDLHCFWTTSSRMLFWRNYCNVRDFTVPGDRQSVCYLCPNSCNCHVFALSGKPQPTFLQSRPWYIAGRVHRGDTVKQYTVNHNVIDRLTNHTHTHTHTVFGKRVLWLFRNSALQSF